MNADERAEIAASLAAHAELGPGYDTAVAEGLIERIGEEIDKRVDARVHASDRASRAAGATAAAPSVPPALQPAQPTQQVAQRRGSGITGLFFGLGSIGLGVGATAAVVSHHGSNFAQIVMVALIWAAIAVINKAHVQRH